MEYLNSTEAPRPASEMHLGAAILSEADIDAQVAAFAAELNGFDDLSDRAHVEELSVMQRSSALQENNLSAFDRQFLAEAGISARNMDEEELAVVARNENRARRAAEAAHTAAAEEYFIFSQMQETPETAPDTGSTKRGKRRLNPIGA